MPRNNLQAINYWTMLRNILQQGYESDWKFLGQTLMLIWLEGDRRTICNSNIVLHKVKAQDVDIIREKGTVVAASK